MAKLVHKLFEDGLMKMIKSIVEEKKTMTDLAKELGVSRGALYSFMAKYDIPTRQQLKKSLVLKKCANCGKEFVRKTGKFCSRDCYLSFLKTFFVKLSCPACGRKFVGFKNNVVNTSKRNKIMKLRI